MTLTEDWQAPFGDTNLCLNGRTISFDNDHKIVIGGGIVLNIYDEPGDKGCITHLPGAKGCAVYIVSGGSFTLNGGSISGNNANEDGGGVYVQAGIITMNGGRISDNISSGCGGGVELESMVRRRDDMFFQIGADITTVSRDDVPEH